MRCQCPEGWPKSLEREFGERAGEVAALNQIPPPRFGVTVHVTPCELPDAPHTIPEDYAHPKDSFGEVVEAEVKPANIVYSIRFNRDEIALVHRAASLSGTSIGKWMKALALVEATSQ